MPRPKRTRRAPAQAVAAVAAAVAEDKSSPAPASGSDIYSHSDRERSVIRKEHEEATSKRMSRSTSLRTRQAQNEVEGASGDDAESAKNPEGKQTSDQQKSESSVEAGRKTRATPAKQRRDTSGLDMDDDLFGLDTTLDDDDDAAAAPPSAPRSDTSTFSVSNFRRRGRAPSISINKDDAPIRPSSRGISTPGISSMFNIGNFRRRQREPSILGTAQKERAQRPLEPSSEPGSGDEDEDDFNPEAESTPINNRRRTQPPPAVEPTSESEAEPVTDSQQILAPDSQPEREAEATSSVKSRKRKSVERHDGDERPGKASRTEPEPELVEDDSDSSLSDLPSPVMTPPRVSNMPRPVTPNQDEIMAPPESSSSEDNDAWPDIHTLAKQRRRRVSLTTPNRDGNISDASSPPSLTHSPNFPATRKNAQKKQQQKQKKVTTADLTGMLPQRRRKKNRDAFDMEESDEEVDTSNLAQDDDELSYTDTRTRSRRAKTTPLNRSTANRPPSRGGKTAQPAPKPRTTSRSNRPSARTYSRRLSDKENQVEDDDEGAAAAGEAEESFAPAEDETLDVEEEQDPTLDAEELKKAASKFKEVDRWELEFEEVTEGSSPNRDGR
ncbi:hypothetical protein CkaCkLH20_08439 [Colletotrichum karsti]|uniref:Uncharacterized protein n=1 Tax=Colletotrichum karsti TaxID=1095194 RepID=A0A9P6LIX9_9PEZI|nr:uncharacterized protein CkaCkLH20_08439 [Colletotrichum karsti]KAF9874067.1 hypothetical protein CkaCkLH20_08439 [Colletotrichum karsti]